MKRTIKSIAAIMVVLTLCLGLIAGCAATSIIGSWKLTAAKISDQEISVADLKEMGAVPDMTITFNEDGTAELVMDGTSNGVTNYTDSGNGVYNINGMDMKLEGGRLVMEYEAMGMDAALIFTK